MLTALLPSNETARLRMLHSLALLDTPPEECFDRATRVLAQLLRVPIAMVSLVDGDRQWFKSKVGLEVCETSRDVAFCAHALASPEMMLVEDALADERFVDNPLVTGEPHVRFYAGVPLTSDDGLVLGALCAVDTKPRTLSEGERAAMVDLARMVERDLLQRSVACDIRLVNAHERQARAVVEARFLTVFQQAPTGKALVNLEGFFTEVNARLCELTGYARETLLSKCFADITYPDDLPADLAMADELLAGLRDTFTLEKRYVCQDGSLVWVELSVSLVRDSDGEPQHFIADIVDISLRKHHERLLQQHQEELEHRVEARTEELSRSRGTLQIITDNLPILISHVDRNLRYLFNNDVYRQVFGVSPQALIGKRIKDVLSHELYTELLPYFERALAGERVVHDHVHYTSDPSRVWAASYIPDIREGEVHGFFVMSQDITERKQIERSLHDKAMRDTLTDLPNRRALNELLIQLAQVPAPEFAVLFLDLDGFKAVNDSYGHDLGDVLLQQVAVRLQHTVRKADFTCRLAGDEFVVVAQGVSSEAIAKRIAEGICRALAEPFVLDGKAARIGASIGVALHVPGSGQGVEAILGRADAAMYAAKRRGKNGYQVAGREHTAAS
ncbi:MULTISPECIES: diguanylate cyclase domain-containing protein [Pseudomonas]|uniref:Diguanylate cyclase n=1 Tax=Pseudomonas quercus TaxID=2722792 RepID=A0ABX0YDN3_9PSED|nr:MULTISPECIES: diguanylate cyclase [Pseudomonas]MBF7141634.1 diguanylate cyclase [Pseudomonas sp. LY10J]NJP00173.1 diguanylate cyclase [Pseudomonas quercus]